MAILRGGTRIFGQDIRIGIPRDRSLSPDAIKKTIKSVQKMATGSGGFSFFMDDEKESKKLAQMLKKHLKRVRIIKLDKQKGDPSDFVVAADMFGL